jgi:hypothetical protein
VRKVPADGGVAVQITRTGGYCVFQSSDYTTRRNREAADLWRVYVSGGDDKRVAGPVRFHPNIQVVGDAYTT